MKKRVKIIISTILVLAIAAVTISAANAPLQASVSVLEEGTAVVTFTEEGRYAYEKEQEVYPMLEGEVLEVFVEVGSKVKAGDPIAVISAKDVEYQIQLLETDIQGYNAQIYNLTLQEQKEKESLSGTRNELLGQVTTLESQMEGYKNTEELRESQIALQEQIVSQNKANVRLARSDTQDAKDYYDDGYLSGDEYSTYRQALNDAKSALAASEQELLRLQNGDVEEGYYEGQRESLQAQLDFIDTRMTKNYSAGMQSYYYSLIESAQTSIQQLQEQQGKSTVTAPCDGYISALPAKDSNMVTRSTVVATIGINPVVEVFVPVREVDGVSVGDAVSMLVQKRIEDTLCTGKVIHMDSQAQIGLSVLGVEESTVRVLVQPEQSALLIGYQVDVEFTVYREEDCLTVPKKAVFQQEDGDYVWVVQDGSAMLQHVIRGVETRDSYIIREGLSSGDIVLTQANVQGLAPGKKVAV